MGGVYYSFEGAIDVRPGLVISQRTRVNGLVKGLGAGETEEKRLAEAGLRVPDRTDPAFEGLVDLPYEYCQWRVSTDGLCIEPLDETTETFVMPGPWLQWFICLLTLNFGVMCQGEILVEGEPGDFWKMKVVDNDVIEYAGKVVYNDELAVREWLLGEARYEAGGWRDLGVHLADREGYGVRSVLPWEVSDGR